MKSMLSFKKIGKILTIIIIISLIPICIVTCYRGGKDLKVGLFGIEQVLHKQSPYNNPLDANRSLFRYAPGFALLQYPFLLRSKMTSPYEFMDILPSTFAWYLFVVLSLVISAATLLRLYPSAGSAGPFKMKLAIIMAMPLISYELANGQNKLLALAFMIGAIYLFEKNRYFLSGILFSAALTVYIPLFVFIFYFAIRGKVRYVLNFIASAFIVFIVIPSLFLGVKFNAFLLRDWFERCIKPFSVTASYATYIDLRPTSQSLPSVIGRIFVTGYSDSYKYAISPHVIHLIVRVISGALVLVSCFAAWKARDERSRGLAYTLFLTLALILPAYCLIYTWSWLFAFYFILSNYINPGTSARDRKLAIIAIAVAFISSLSTTIMFFNIISVLFWGTLITWAIAVCMLFGAGKPESGTTHG